MSAAGRTTAGRLSSSATFEFTVLCAVAAGLVGMLLASCRLPRLYHPIFAAKAFRARLGGPFLPVRRGDATRASIRPRYAIVRPTWRRARSRRCAREAGPAHRHRRVPGALALAACDNMANQPKRLPYELPYGAEANWPVLPPPASSRATSSRCRRRRRVTLALLERGQQRFDIYCAPCHGRMGDGHGMIVQRGFPQPPSYYIERLREARSQHFYDVITHGYGAMYPYAARVEPADRWAIIAYIRALQASVTAELADVPPDKRQALQ